MVAFAAGAGAATAVGRVAGRDAGVGGVDVDVGTDCAELEPFAGWGFATVVTTAGARLTADWAAAAAAWTCRE